MISQTFEVLRFRTNGKFDFARMAIVGVILGPFIIWRLFGSGSHEASSALRYIEDEFIQDYKYAQYQVVEAAREAANGGAYDHSPIEKFEGLEVKFSNVSVAAPLLRWSANENVVVRFDYKLWAGGEIVERGEDVYKLVSGPGGNIYDSGPIHFYVKRFF